MDTLKARFNSTVKRLQALLAPHKWSLTGDWLEVPEPIDEELERFAEELSRAVPGSDEREGLVFRAGQREAGLLEAHVDEGELGQFAFVMPGEVFDPTLAGLVVIAAHVASGTTVSWVYKPGEYIELPHAVDGLPDLQHYEGAAA